MVLTTGLLLAAAIGVPIGTTAQRWTPLNTLGGTGQTATGTLSPGEIEAYGRAEGGPYAGFVIPSPKLVAEQAQAEGGYYGRNLFPPNSHQRHGH